MSFDVGGSYFPERLTANFEVFPSRDIAKVWTYPTTNRQALNSALKQLNPLKDRNAIYVCKNLHKLVSKNCFPLAFNLDVLMRYWPLSVTIEEVLYRYALDVISINTVDGNNIACLICQYLACVDTYHGELLLDTLTLKGVEQENQHRLICAASYLNESLRQKLSYSISITNDPYIARIRKFHAVQNRDFDDSVSSEKEKKVTDKQYKSAVFAYCLKRNNTIAWNELNKVFRAASLTKYNYYLEQRYCPAEYYLECHDLNRERLSWHLEGLTDREWLRFYYYLERSQKLDGLSSLVKLYITQPSVSGVTNVEGCSFKTTTQTIKPNLIGKVTLV